MRSLKASTNSSGLGGVRAASAFALNGPSTRCLRPVPTPSRLRASEYFSAASSSIVEVPCRTSRNADRLVRALPRSASRTISRTRINLFSLLALNGLPLAQAWTLLRDTLNRSASCSHVNPETRRTSSTAWRVVSLARPGTSLEARVPLHPLTVAPCSWTNGASQALLGAAEEVGDKERAPPTTITVSGGSHFCRNADDAVSRLAGCALS